MLFPSKNQNPREGIETGDGDWLLYLSANGLQKTKIPARGLKPINRTLFVPSITAFFKKPKSPRGD